MGLAHNNSRSSFRVSNLAAGEVVCRQHVSWRPVAAEQTTENNNKDRDGGGSDERVGAGIRAGKFGTVKAQIELEQEQDTPQGGNCSRS